MSGFSSLGDLLVESASRYGTKCAVALAGGSEISYGALDRLSDKLRDRLVHLGVRAGDRVGLRLHKSIDSVATIFGILKAGAAYVPVDADSPAARCAYILNNCEVKVLVTERAMEAGIALELANVGASPTILAIDNESLSGPLDSLLSTLQKSDPAKASPSAKSSPGDLAYILYTSGSTGLPKGVALTHGNAMSFVDWCSETLTPSDQDVFSSHAPFHFDLSILDLFVAMKHGATLTLIPESLGKDPIRLAPAIADAKITIWYSTPSILSLLANYGKLDRYDFSALRIVLFAGEVFPIPQFLVLHRHWQYVDYYNLYGPTETNVCTWYQVPRDLAALTHVRTFPIGRICPPNQGMVVDEGGDPVATGEEGELLVSGPNVMAGYWNLPEQTSRAFLETKVGKRWYRTGDIVREESEGSYVYVSRRDRMVKRRGYRVELGEIEVALMRHPSILEAAVVSVQEEETGVKVQAFVSCRDGESTTVIALKKHSSEALPPYMIPDVFSILDRLPRTSTDKIDYQALKSRCR